MEGRQENETDRQTGKQTDGHFLKHVWSSVLPENNKCIYLSSFKKTTTTTTTKGGGGEAEKKRHANGR